MLKHSFLIAKGAFCQPPCSSCHLGGQVLRLDALLVVDVVGGGLCLHHFMHLGKVFVQSGQRLFRGVVDLAARDLLTAHRKIGGVRLGRQAAAVELDFQLVAAEVSFTVERHVVEHETNGQRVIVADLAALVFDVADDASAEVSATTQREFARVDETVREILGEGGGDCFVKIDGVHGVFLLGGGGAFPHPIETVYANYLNKAIRETSFFNK